MFKNCLVICFFCYLPFLHNLGFLSPISSGSWNVMVQPESSSCGMSGSITSWTYRNLKGVCSWRIANKSFPHNLDIQPTCFVVTEIEHQHCSLGSLSYNNFKPIKTKKKKEMQMPIVSFLGTDVFDFLWIFLPSSALSHSQTDFCAMFCLSIGSTGLMGTQLSLLGKSS